VSFKRPTEETLREEGADGASNPPRSVEGTVVTRHAVMPSPYPELYRRRESVRGGSAWKPDGSFMAGWKADDPLIENGDARAWLLVPLGATPVPLGRGAGAVCGVRRG
jgi:hypothetical protein